MKCLALPTFVFVNAGAVVARVRMTRMTEVAYGAAVKAVVDRCNRENKCDLPHTLKGIIVDWASAQIANLKDALGDECAEELIRGCKVNIHIVSQKYCHAGFSYIANLACIPSRQQV